MSRYRVQPYQHDADLSRIVDFVRAVRPAPLRSAYPSADELPELLALPVNQATARLWLDPTGRLTAFAYVDAFHTLRFDIDWQTRDPTLDQAIVAWGETCVRGRSPVLIATSPEADQRRRLWLERQGFTRRADAIVHMTCALDTDLPEPGTPPGFTIRPVVGESEAAAVAAVHRAAFGTEHMTTERRLRIMRARSYDPDLDLVAVAPDGTLAAYGLGQPGSDHEPGIGYADLFATHPSYRGQGLAGALMQRIVRRLQPKGYRAARLSTDSDNHAMQQVARTAGFRITATTLRFQRTVSVSRERP